MALDEYLSFVEEIEKLKSVVRTAWTSKGRRESTAEHSWRLAIFAYIMYERYPELDLAKLLMMSLLHDIGEIYDGDVSAVLSPDKEDKYRMERKAAQKVFARLPEPLSSTMMALWTEYNENETEEARLIKALDKAETIIQHNQGENPADFNYQFSLGYGKEYFEQDETLRLLRGKIDDETRQKIISCD